MFFSYFRIMRAKVRNFFILSMFLPKNFALSAVDIYFSCQSKQVVAQAVDVSGYVGVYFNVAAQGYYAAFGASGHGAGNVGAGCVGVSARQYELSQCGQVCVYFVNGFFESFYCCGSKRCGLPLRLGLGCESGTDVKQCVLNVEQLTASHVGYYFGSGQ